MKNLNLLVRKIYQKSPESLKKIIFYIFLILYKIPRSIFRIVKINKFENARKESYLDIFWGSSNVNTINFENSSLLEDSIKYFRDSLSIKLDFKKPSDHFKLYSYEFDNVNSAPGEHYRFLAAITKNLKPKNIIEIGTGSGISAKVFHEFSNANIYTFDIFDINIENSYLSVEEVKSERMKLINSNIESVKEFNKYKEIIAEADLIFLDASKTGVLEDKILSNFASIEYNSNNTLLIIDDIKFLTMFEVWNKIHSPKFDASSLAHWSGTGLVQFSKKFYYG